MPEWVEVLNQTDFPLQERAVAHLGEQILAAEAVAGGLTLAFLPEPVMADLNQRYRNQPEATDVLSFPEGEEGEWPDVPQRGASGVAVYLGDVAICPSVAVRFAEEEGIPPAEEIARLMIHGVLHLLGQDHETDEGEMLRRQESLLRELAPLLPSLIATD